MAKKEELKIHQRHMMNSKDKRELILELNTILKEDVVGKILTKKSKVERIKIGNKETLYAINDVLALWHTQDDEIIPLLSFLMKKDVEWKSIIVDKGAIKFMSKGADVMRPGITSIDPTIAKGDIVLIKDPIHGKVLSIGKAMFGADEMEKKDGGKVLKCVHSLTDSIYEFSKKL